MAALNNLPVKTINGATVFLHDVANVRDGYAVQQNIVRQDGQRGVMMSIEKTGDASTLAIVSAVRAELPKVAATLPKTLVMKTLLDQSIFVRSSLEGVVREGVIAAGLTSLLILVFLGSWRSTLIICTSIPLSIITAVIILSAIGETINIMTLGGLALAVGILVDDATVEIENLERQLGLGKELKQAILDGAEEIAVPAFVSTLCISIVFVPMLFLTGVPKYLFVPLAEAVIFSLLASYFFSRTIIPTMVQFLMRKEVERHRSGQHEHGWFARLHARFNDAFARLQARYATLLATCVEHRRTFAAAFLCFCLASLTLIPLLGNDFFPSVDTGQFRLHVRAKTGTRIEDTAREVDQIERAIRTMIPPAEMSGILDNIGVPTSGINLSYSNSGTIGSADAEILGSLATKHKPTDDYIERMRRDLPRMFPGTSFFFEPADIVSQTLNFGLPAPLDVQIVGKDMEGNFAAARNMLEQIRQIPGAVDVHIQQQLDQPRLNYTLDRVRAQQLGLSTRDVSTSLLVALSSSFQTSPNLWLDPKNGVSYLVAVQTPQYQIASLDDLRTIPITSSAAGAPPATTGAQLFKNVTTMAPTEEPADVDHYNVQRVIDIYGSVQGTDLGRVAAQVQKITTEAAKHLPTGSHLVVRGQVATMKSSFTGLYLGLAFAIVLVYLLLVVNFQSWSEAFLIITALPGALAGISWILFLTHTSLSVPALMGAIMSIGVATSNSVLVVTFANERLAENGNALRAAIEAGATRLRPVIMTATAMIIGMIPMALGLGDGGEQNAPLGRAVIGGLLFATIATLFFVPTVYAMVRANATAPAKAKGNLDAA